MKQRILTALLLLPLIAAIVFWAPPMLFSLVIAAVSAGAMYEFCQMAYKDRRSLESKISAGLSAVMVLIFANAGTEVALFVGVLSFFALTLLFLFRFEDITTVAGDLAQMVLAFIYIPLLLVHFCWLHAGAHGREWIFLCMMIVMFCDSFAYFTGVSIGKTRLYPQISPKKSVEGSIGGAVGSLVSVFIARYTFFPELSTVDAVILGLFMSTFGQLGDLFESMLKRSYDVKDSGNIIPGHGGLLDRLDSLLFAFPAAYYYSQFVFA